MAESPVGNPNIQPELRMRASLSCHLHSFRLDLGRLQVVPVMSSIGYSVGSAAYWVYFYLARSEVCSTWSSFGLRVQPSSKNWPYLALDRYGDR